MLQNLDISSKLKNDVLFSSLFWQSVGQGEFLVKFLWLIWMTLYRWLRK